MKKVLFISHNAGRNGAPLMLLNMLRWLKEHTDLSFEILLRASGPLQQDFSAVAPTFIYQRQKGSNHFLRQLTRRLGLECSQEKYHRSQLLKHFQESGIGLIYSNTFTNGDILHTLAPLGCPVITHAHEMEGWIQQSGQENIRQVLLYTSHFIAASQACKKNLMVNHGLPDENISVVHSFIPAQSTRANPAETRKKLGIPEGAFVVVASGHEYWRKGKDLFIQLAAKVKKALPERVSSFIWVGGWQKEEDRRNILQAIQKLDLADRICFTGEVENPLDYFAIGDVFASVSREDTFPLVCLEAAALGKPVLCFSGAGGMPEFVGEDAGFVLPYLDLDLMTEKLALLAADPVLRNSLGKRAAEKVRLQYDIATGSKAIKDIIRNCQER